MCTLCRNPVRPEVEYDCENTRYSHSCHAQYGLDDCDQKVGITITVLFRQGPVISSYRKMKLVDLEFFSPLNREVVLSSRTSSPEPALPGFLPPDLFLEDLALSQTST